MKTPQKFKRLETKPAFSREARDKTKKKSTASESSRCSILMQVVSIYVCRKNRGGGVYRCGVESNSDIDCMPLTTAIPMIQGGRGRGRAKEKKIKATLGPHFLDTIFFITPRLGRKEGQARWKRTSAHARGNNHLLPTRVIWKPIPLLWYVTS